MEECKYCGTLIEEGEVCLKCKDQDSKDEERTYIG